ncbi:Mn2+/Fe2+ NRAMP family transporter [Murinocardiopsis flavida]|uniref:Mn2+/Fe2+ NRAMP family transporter n=1 Tax=Murinocardiopsis flavida TaxID=645275 RepID=A0A2P8D3N9_9ACTN|nr:Nramp family divalent metal transporter [Murinocardiopsis flavida]PSK91833.1 Mn2+/Fe2+ NRAMP family transporter [Murinocardiopsis flavida]
MVKSGSATRPGGTGRRRWSIGPAFVTAALVFGPGSITLASSIGAGYGYALLWVLVVAAVFMLSYTGMAVRLGIGDSRSPLEVIRARLTPWLAVLVGVGCFLVTAAFQAGNSVGAGAATAILVGGNVQVTAALFTALGIAFVWLPSFYRHLERVMVVLVVAMFVLFAATAVVSRPSLGGIASGLVPSVPSGSALLVVALMGTSFSVVGAFYQAYLVQEKGWRPEQRGSAMRDTALGIALLGGLTAVIVIGAAAVLRPQEVAVTSAGDMAAILEPTIGPWARTLFALGLWAAAFSSLVGNATIGGCMLADALGLGRSLSAPVVKLFISGVMFLGGAVAVAFAANPVQLIITAQAATVLVVPMVGAVLLYLAADRRLLGALANRWWQNVLGAVGLLALLLLAWSYVVQLS